MSTGRHSPKGHKWWHYVVTGVAAVVIAVTIMYIYDLWRVV